MASFIKRLAMFASFTLAGTVLLGASGCSAAPADDSGTEDGAASALGDTPTLTFEADGDILQSSDLKAGGKLRVKYDEERLPQCRGDFMGQPGWRIGGFVSFDGKPAQSFAAKDIATLSIPASTRDVALWFQVTNRWGCSEYDSKLGANYHFKVGGAPEVDSGSVIAFTADGKMEQKGDLVAGTKVTVRYAQDRLPECRGSQGGIPQWTLNGKVSFNGGQARPFETTEPTTTGDRKDVDVTLELTEAGQMALWFENANRYGCRKYDSNDGKNYTFTVK